MRQSLLILLLIIPLFAGSQSQSQPYFPKQLERHSDDSYEAGELSGHKVIAQNIEAPRNNSAVVDSLDSNDSRQDDSTRSDASSLPKKLKFFYITLESLAVILLITFSILYIWYRAYRRIKEQKETTAQLLKEKEELLERLTNTQNQLIQSEKMASLGQLTAGIAHEINNPINFITTSVQGLKLDFADLQLLLRKLNLLEKKEKRDSAIEDIIEFKKEIGADFLEVEITQLIDNIEEGANRTHEIVKHLRTFSRNTGSEFLESDIHEGLDSSLIMLKSKFLGRIQIHKDYGSLPKVKCQITRLNQCFLNILDNAIYAIKGEGDIYITTRHTDNRISLSIRDTGIGMDEVTKNRIFEPFFTTKDVGEGTGLGLSSSFGIIEQHGGTIRVESKKGKGTEFIIELPVSQ